MELFIAQAADNPWFYFSWIFIVTFSICVHEYAHAWTAWHSGDDTAALAGHLTLNPLRQMGLMSLAMLAVLGIAWGRVPVDPYRLKGRGAAAKVSIAGPAANFALIWLFAASASALTKWGGTGEHTAMLLDLARLGAYANGVLFVLNMMPAPMLDGWSVFALFLPFMRRVTASQAQTLTWIFIILIFMTPLWELVWIGGDNLAEFAQKTLGG